MLSMKYAKGDFQLEKHKVSLCLCFLFSVLCFRICFCLFLCAFSVLSLYLLLFCVLLCCDLPAGKKLFKNVDIFRSFSPSVSLSLSPPATGDNNKANCALCSRRCSLFPSFSVIHYTTRTLAYFAFGPFAFGYFLFFLFFLLLCRLFSFCVVLFVFGFVLF